MLVIVVIVLRTARVHVKAVQAPHCTRAMYDITHLTSRKVNCHIIVTAQLLYMAGRDHWSSCPLTTWYERCPGALACVGVSGRVLLTLLAQCVTHICTDLQTWLMYKHADNYAVVTRIGYCVTDANTHVSKCSSCWRLCHDICMSNLERM